jgi:putative membrane protein
VAFPAGMNWFNAVALALGIALVAALFIAFDPAAIAASAAACGWGILVVAGWRMVVIGCDALAWRQLIPATRRPAFPRLYVARWIAKSINTLLPVAQIGGDLARTRWLWRTGATGPVAGASVVVDITINLAAQVLFTILGTLTLATLDRHNPLLVLTVAMAAVGALVVVAFIGAQRLGLLRLFAAAAGRFGAGRRAARLAGALAELHHQANLLYATPLLLLGATSWHLLGWLLRAGETWLALHFMGVGIALPGALVIESLSGLVRTAAFAIPGGLGAQETAILLIGSHLGLSPGTAIALALVKRVQEFIVCAPGLIAWWCSERSAATRRPGESGTTAVRRPSPPAPEIDLGSGQPGRTYGEAGARGSIAEP